jgi:hypothetical protein
MEAMRGRREGDTEKERTEKGCKRILKKQNLIIQQNTPKGKPGEVLDMCSIDEVHNKHKSLA